MIVDDIIRDLAKTAGHECELTDADVTVVRRKLANAFVDMILDGQEIINDGKAKCSGVSPHA
jgi:hypothetical protein